MTEDEIAAIQTSFAAMAPLSLEVARRFYHHLFEKNPQLMSIFHGDLHSQGQKLMDMLDFIVTNIGNPDTLLPAVRELGVRHVGYQVKTEHYEMVGESLIFAMGELLGDAFTEEAEAAWKKAYAFLAEVMIEAANEVIAETEASS